MTSPAAEPAVSNEQRREPPFPGSRIVPPRGEHRHFHCADPSMDPMQFPHRRLKYKTLAESVIPWCSMKCVYPDKPWIATPDPASKLLPEEDEEAHEPNPQEASAEALPQDTQGVGIDDRRPEVAPPRRKASRLSVQHYARRLSMFSH